MVLNGGQWFPRILVSSQIMVQHVGYLWHDTPGPQCIQLLIQWDQTRLLPLLFSGPFITAFKWFDSSKVKYGSLNDTEAVSWHNVHSFMLSHSHPSTLPPLHILRPHALRYLTFSASLHKAEKEGARCGERLKFKTWMRCLHLLPIQARVNSYHPHLLSINTEE